MDVKRFIALCDAARSLKIPPFLFYCNLLSILLTTCVTKNLTTLRKTIKMTRKNRQGVQTDLDKLLF